MFGALVLICCALVLMRLMSYVCGPQSDEVAAAQDDLVELATETQRQADISSGAAVQFSPSSSTAEAVRAVWSAVMHCLCSY